MISEANFLGATREPNSNSLLPGTNAGRTNFNFQHLPVTLPETGWVPQVRKMTDEESLLFFRHVAMQRKVQNNKRLMVLIVSFVLAAELFFLVYSRWLAA